MSKNCTVLKVCKARWIVTLTTRQTFYIEHTILLHNWVKYNSWCWHNDRLMRNFNVRDLWSLRLKSFRTLKLVHNHWDIYFISIIGLIYINITNYSKFSLTIHWYSKVGEGLLLNINFEFTDMSKTTLTKLRSTCSIYINQTWRERTHLVSELNIN